MCVHPLVSVTLSLSDLICFFVFSFCFRWDLAMQARLTLDTWQFSCLSQRRVRVTGVSHHAWYYSLSPLHTHTIWVSFLCVWLG